MDFIDRTRPAGRRIRLGKPCPISGDFVGRCASAVRRIPVSRTDLRRVVGGIVPDYSNSARDILELEMDAEAKQVLNRRLRYCEAEHLD